LQKALPALDFVFGPSPLQASPPSWTLGGGTALALRIFHRLSDDIDVFTAAAPLRAFTPARNPAAKAISKRFQWPGHYLKFECERGEIDFLSSHLQTTPGFTAERYRGRDIALETAAEIIVKKVRYRSGSFTQRDIFDLAAVARREPGLAGTLSIETPDALGRLKVVIEARRARDPQLAPEVRPTNDFTDLLESAYTEALQIIDAARRLADH
jgi:hypothetical protein